MTTDKNFSEMRLQEEEGDWWDEYDDSEGLLPPLPPLPALKPSQERYKHEILEMLANPRKATIRIDAWHGCGNRTIMQHVVNEVVELYLFDAVMVIGVRGCWVEEVQEKIAKGLSLKVEAQESVDSLAAKIGACLKGKKYLLCLHSARGYSTSEFVEGTGVPQPNQQNGCKIVSLIEYITNSDLRIRCIVSKEEAWELFREKAGEVVDSPNIEPLAQQVVESFYPTDLTEINMAATTMKDVKDESLWTELSQKYRPFQFWYKRIASDEEKICSSFCCLFEPEYEMDINELIGYWISDGLFDGSEEEGGGMLYRRGLGILKRLLDSCILQRVTHNSVRMHIRTWEYLRHMNDRFRVTPQYDDINGELMENLSLLNIEGFLNIKPKCPRLTTLLLWGKSKSARISDVFFENMPMLRILHLYGLVSLPSPISKLHDLRKLVLKECKILRMELDLRLLKKLVMLDVSGTLIESLPESVSTLYNLRKLLAKNCRLLKRVPDLAKLDKLEVLEVSVMEIDECPDWIFNSTRLRHLNWYHSGFDSLTGQFPNKLAAIMHVSDANFFCTFSKYAHSLPQCFQQFYFCVSPHIDQDRYDGIYFKSKQFIYNHIYPKAKYFSTSADHDRWFEINGSTSSWGSIGGALNHADLLSLSDNNSLLSLSELDFKNMKELRECWIERCPKIAFIVNGEEAKGEEIFEQLENLFVSNLSNLMSICSGSFLPGSFACLKHVYLDCCPKLKIVFSSALVVVEKLETLEIRYCDKLEMIFKEEVEGECVFPCLKSLLLWELPELESICRGDFSAPRLEKIKVKECPKLKSIPLVARNAGTEERTVEEITEVERVVERRRWYQIVAQYLRPSFKYLNKRIFTCNTSAT